ncbi:MAG TPA: sensor domain-containing diguanylate cyclase [Geobacteraceae bacterium]|nr:sensor domain-containing diguanylate cyclase [Geobacteraceae bacterium]
MDPPSRWGRVGEKGWRFSSSQGVRPIKSIKKALERQRIVNEEKNRIFEVVGESDERYRKLVELSPDGIIITSECRFVFMNPSGIRILAGEHDEEFIGRSVFEFIHRDHRRIVAERLRKLEEDGDQVPWMEVKFVCLDGREIDVEFAATLFTLDGKMAVQSIFRDITERKLAEEHLEFLANFDPLTGLPNRRLFFDRLGQSLLSARRQGYLVGLLFLDLDRFKEVNDSYGHAVGDLLLKEVSERLAQSLRLSDSVARMGGDEFTVILTKIVDPEDAAIVAKRIVGNLARPFYLQGHTASIGVSIGISIYPVDGEDSDELLKKADTAMYRAKGEGSNLFRYFS